MAWEGSPNGEPDIFQTAVGFRRALSNRSGGLTSPAQPGWVTVDADFIPTENIHGL
jgi:hypothetical protein